MQPMKPMAPMEPQTRRHSPKGRCDCRNLRHLGQKVRTVAVFMPLGQFGGRPPLP